MIIIISPQHTINVVKTIMAVVEPRPPTVGEPHRPRYQPQRALESTNQDKEGIVSERRNEIEQNRERKQFEERELRVRDELEEIWSRDSTTYKHIQTINKTIIHESHQYNQINDDIVQEESIEFSLVIHSHASSIWKIDSQQSKREELITILMTEESNRDRFQLLESNYRRQLNNLNRNDWLHSRGKELQRTQPELDIEEEELTEQLLEQLRLSRKEHLQVDKEIRELEEKADLISNQTAAFLHDLSSEESYLRSVVESDESINSREMLIYQSLSTAFVGEAMNRSLYESTWVTLWISVLQKLFTLHLQDAVHKRAIEMKQFTLEEHSSWLQHRKREMEREQEDQFLEEASLAELRKKKLKVLERMDSSVISYYRAEADDRSLILSKQLWAWRDLVDNANHAMKEAVLRIITRQVEDEYKSQILSWTPELWKVLEDGQVDYRSSIRQEESSCRNFLESDEIRSFLRTRNMELQRESENEKNIQPAHPIPESPPSLSWKCEEFVTRQLQRHTPLEAIKVHEELHAEKMTILRKKWDEEQKQAAAKEEDNKQERVKAFEKNIEALRSANRSRMLADDRDVIESSEERKRTEIKHQQTSSWGQLLGVSRRPSSAPVPKHLTTDEKLSTELFSLCVDSQSTKRNLIKSQQNRHRQVLQQYFKDSLCNELYSMEP